MNRKMTEDHVDLQKQVDDGNAKLQKQANDHNAKLQKQVDELSEKMSRMCEMQTEAMKEARQVMAEIKYIKQMMQCQQLTRGNTIIAGGDLNGSINSVEILTWPQKIWTLQNPMLTCRNNASAVVYQGNVYITGGYDQDNSTDTMEIGACGELPLQWNISPVKLPEVCQGHATVMYEDSLILSGGKIVADSEVSDKIYEISMVPPYSTKVLTTMPESRYDHTMELFEDKLFIFGGYDGGYAKDTVMMYNLVTKEWKMMTPLPFAVDEMATVLWQNNVILLGGRDHTSEDYDALDTAVMYNLRTGESKYLPSMKHKRGGCAAVVTGNVLVVMGGRSKENYLNSVEAFHFQEQVWEELPDMNEARGYASAVVKPN